MSALFDATIRALSVLDYAPSDEGTYVCEIEDFGWTECRYRVLSWGTATRIFWDEGRPCPDYGDAPEVTLIGARQIDGNGDPIPGDVLDQIPLNDRDQIEREIEEKIELEQAAS